MAEKMNICVRIAANGDPHVQPRFERDTKTWLDYNMSARGGNALYINGVYQNPEDHGMKWGKHCFADEKQEEINELTAEAERRLAEKPIPEDWHLNEGRYYPPGKNFVSSGSYAVDSIRDIRSGPFKF
ncbi:MAG: hypothetical protein JXR12_06425 [Neptunomonas phycophila]|uniref:hypothetical protein n=1 Tax=Neptunomonas phycophila TaxID=1572645 RepID=UPI003B8D2AB2